MILDLPRQAILAALLQFDDRQRPPNRPAPDRLYRQRPLFAILHDQRYYPAREILRLAVSAAAGQRPPQQAGGSNEINTYLRSRGFLVVRLPSSVE